MVKKKKAVSNASSKKTLKGGKKLGKTKLMFADGSVRF